MARVLLYIEGNPVMWTTLFWTYALGTLYLVYQYGFRSAADRGLKLSA